MSEDNTEVSSKEAWGGGVSPVKTSYGKQMMWFFLVSDALTFGALLTALGFMKHRFADVWPLCENVFYHFPGTHAHLPLIYVALMTFILIVSSVTMVMAVEAGHRLDKKGVIKWLAATVVGGLFFLTSQAWEWDTFIKGNEAQSTAFLLPSDNENIAHLRFSDDHYMFNEDGLGNPVELAIQAINSGEASLELANKSYASKADAVKFLENNAEQIQGANLKRNEYGLPLYANFFFCITGFHGFHVFSGVLFNLIILVQVMIGTYDKRGHFEMIEKTGLYWHFIDLVWVFVFTFFYLI